MTGKRWSPQHYGLLAPTKEAQHLTLCFGFCLYADGLHPIVTVLAPAQA
jgi:hypothetical protein